MSSPSSPPTRPVPVPPEPAEEAQTPPAPSEPLTSVDDEIDQSTLRFLSSSFRSLFLPYLFRLVVFTACAKLVRVFSPALLRFVARVVSLAWRALSALVRFAAWAGMYLGLVATALWLLAGAGAALVYAYLRLRPRYRVWATEHPRRARAATKAGVYGAGWGAARLALGAWAGRFCLTLLVAYEVWAFFGQRVPTTTAGSRADRERVAAHPSAAAASPSAGGDDAPSSAFDDESEPPRAETAEPGTEVDDDELERWARNAREEMLRDSLLRQRKKGGGGGGGVTGEGEGGGGGQDDAARGHEDGGDEPGRG
ncbi:uncharacterized protein JCM10292_004954 [Rhodotorula paludigena]|uniref:uncharacterized protein n=1 Tax=Rhodotorula paludigena TaxID=86838 RepID=UPI003182624F